MTWTLAEAKDQLSRVVRQAVDEGPQTISVRGRETAVVIAKEDYDRLKPVATPRDFKSFLLSIPSLEGVDLERDGAPAPEIEI
jgi:prevent-host-death family protein